MKKMKKYEPISVSFNYNDKDYKCISSDCPVSYIKDGANFLGVEIELLDQSGETLYKDHIKLLDFAKEENKQRLLINKAITLLEG